MPILSFDTLDGVPEGLREFAKTDEQSGKVKVNVVAASKIDEFRDNNIKISKERDDLLTALKPYRDLVGEDIDAFRTDLDDARMTRERVKAGELKESRAVEEAVAKRTEEMRKNYEDQLKAQGREMAAWKTKSESSDGLYRQTLVKQAIKDAAIANADVDNRALDDIVSRGMSIFKCDDHGRVQPFNGDAPIYGADGVSPMTTHEWVGKLKETAPYFFKASQGGGASGSSEKGGHNGKTRADLMKMSPRERLAFINNEPGAKL